MKVLGFADKTSASTNCNKTLQHFGDQSRGWGGKRRLTRSGIGYHMVPSFQQVWTNKDCMCFLHIAWSGNKIKQNYSSVTHSHTSVQWGSRCNGGHRLQRWLMILHQLLMLCLCGLLYIRVHSISMKIPLLVPIGPVSKSTHCLCHCKQLQVPLRLAQGTTIHKCQWHDCGCWWGFLVCCSSPWKVWIWGKESWHPVGRSVCQQQNQQVEEVQILILHFVRMFY